MNTIDRNLRTAVALALAAAGYLGAAQAVPVVSISPASQDVACRRFGPASTSSSAD